MRIHLEVQTGAQAGRRIEAHSGEILKIGRSVDADLSIPDDRFLSAVHFTIQCGVNICSISDNHSSNGILVNGLKVLSKELSDGDQIAAGQTRFCIHMGQVASSAMPVRAALRSSAVEQASCNILTMLQDAFQPLYAIWDAAGDPQTAELLQGGGQEFASLYEGKRGNELASVAPFLIRLTAQSPFLETLYRRGCSKNCGIYFTCDLPLPEVRKHLRRFLTVTLPDGDKVIFRFYDPRVLRTFLPTLYETEAAEFFGPIRRYVLTDETPDAFLQFDWQGGEIRKKRLTK